MGLLSHLCLWNILPLNLVSKQWITLWFTLTLVGFSVTCSQSIPTDKLTDRVSTAVHFFWSFLHYTDSSLQWSATTLYVFLLIFLTINEVDIFSHFLWRSVLTTWTECNSEEKNWTNGLLLQKFALYIHVMVIFSIYHHRKEILILILQQCLISRKSLKKVSFAERALTKTRN